MSLWKEIIEVWTELWGKCIKFTIFHGLELKNLLCHYSENAMIQSDPQKSLQNYLESNSNSICLELGTVIWKDFKTPTLSCISCQHNLLSVLTEWTPFFIQYILHCVLLSDTRNPNRSRSWSRGTASQLSVHSNNTQQRHKVFCFFFSLNKKLQRNKERLFYSTV